MEHLDLDGKRYMKVSSAARETGYTADYIGQLCRAGKIDAKLVGRTWYVAADEISDHRRTRGRSSHEKVRQNVKEQLSQNKETHIPIRHLASGTHRKHILQADVRYHTDETELIPTVTSVKVDVASSDKEEVISTHGEGGKVHHVQVVERDTEKSVPVFKPVEKSEVKWNGTIVVQPLETEEEKASAAATKSNTMPVERHVKMKSENERNNKPNLVISDVSHDPLDAKKRFLERMNLAHELNAPVARQSEIKTVKAARGEQVIRRTAPPVSVAPEAASSLRYGLHKGHRIASWTLSAAAAVGVFFMIATTFLESASEYKAASGTQNSVFLSTFSVTSLESATEMLTERISGIRLLSQISLF